MFKDEEVAIPQYDELYKGFSCVLIKSMCISALILVLPCLFSVTSRAFPPRTRLRKWSVDLRLTCFMECNQGVSSTVGGNSTKALTLLTEKLSGISLKTLPQSCSCCHIGSCTVYSEVWYCQLMVQEGRQATKSSLIDMPINVAAVW